MEFSILAELVLIIGTFVLGIGLVMGVELSGIADDGYIDDGGNDDCSGNGANGTLDEYGTLGEYAGGFTLLMMGACATVGCSLLANGTATVDVMGSAAAMAILFINNFKFIAKIRLSN